VLLITRRNEALQGIMKDFIDKEKASKGKGKKTGTNGTKGRAKK
jgi:hypothetical protein